MAAIQRGFLKKIVKCCLSVYTPNNISIPLGLAKIDMAFLLFFGGGEGGWGVCGEQKLKAKGKIYYNSNANDGIIRECVYFFVYTYTCVYNPLNKNKLL